MGSRESQARWLFTVEKGAEVVPWSRSHRGMPGWSGCAQIHVLDLKAWICGEIGEKVQRRLRSRAPLLASMLPVKQLATELQGGWGM